MVLKCRFRWELFGSHDVKAGSSFVDSLLRDYCCALCSFHSWVSAAPILPPSFNFLSLFMCSIFLLISSFSLSSLHLLFICFFHVCLKQTWSLIFSPQGGDLLHCQQEENQQDDPWNTWSKQEEIKENKSKTSLHLFPLFVSFQKILGALCLHLPWKLEPTWHHLWADQGSAGGPGAQKDLRPEPIGPRVHPPRP